MDICNRCSSLNNYNIIDGLEKIELRLRIISI